MESRIASYSNEVQAKSPIATRPYHRVAFALAMEVGCVSRSICRRKKLGLSEARRAGASSTRIKGPLSFSIFDINQLEERELQFV